MFKRFPSYEYLVANAIRAARRFPLTLLSALVVTVVLVYLVGLESSAGHENLVKLAIVAGLGLPLFTALAVFAEKRGYRGAVSLGMQVIGAALLAVIYIITPSDTEVYEPLLRLVMLGVAFHFLVAFLPYLGGDQVQGFWQFNMSLFVRFLIAALFAAVMFGGLAIALAAGEQLFEFDIDEKRFIQLWVIVAFMFTTWVFLAGIPEDLNRLNQAREYPKEVRVFAQYVLLPLVALYLVILYLYAAKILFSWNWPQGWVSHLILWYSVVSILALLLLWPLRDQTNNRWVQTFTKWFFRLLVPLIVMLFLAIFERVGDYGITVNRYLVIAMACGLSIVVLYFILSRNKDIRVIPAVVFLIALIAAYGPVSAFTVSEGSQIRRMEELLRKNNIAVDREGHTSTYDIPSQDRSEMSSIITYLNEWHGKEVFVHWFSDSVLASLTDTERAIPMDIAPLFGFKYEDPWVQSGGWEHRYFDLQFGGDEAVAVSDFDYLIPVNSYDRLNDTTAASWHVGGDSCRVILHRPKATLEVLFDHGTPEKSRLLFDLTDTVVTRAGLGTLDDVTQPSVDYLGTVGDYSVRLVLQGLAGQVGVDSVTVNRLDGVLLIRSVAHQ